MEKAKEVNDELNKLDASKVGSPERKLLITKLMNRPSEDFVYIDSSREKLTGLSLLVYDDLSAYMGLLAELGIKGSVLLRDLEHIFPNIQTGQSYTTIKNILIDTKAIIAEDSSESANILRNLIDSFDSKCRLLMSHTKVPQQVRCNAVPYTLKDIAAVIYQYALSTRSMVCMQGDTYLEDATNLIDEVSSRYIADLLDYAAKFEKNLC